ncbi:MAG: hypothetical protein JXC32_19445 [Anaerolineae bacterium]|nr:hypothetical protein [Anaerolineae bacterium]
MKSIRWLHRSPLGILACALLVALTLTACGDGTAEPVVPTDTAPAEEATPIPAAPEEEPAPTATSEPTEAPPPTAAPDAFSYVPVELSEVGLVVEVPGTWVRLEPDAVWVPEVTEAPAAMIHPRIGVKMVELQPPAEAEAFLLPQPGQILASEELVSSLGSGRSFLVEVYGLAAEGEVEEQADVISVEKHVLVSVMEGDRRLAYDFYAAAESVEGLAALDAAVAHIAQTATMMPISMPVEGGQANLDNPAVMGAKARLAQHLGVPESDITAVSAEFVNWPDACLGVHEAGQMCAQVITPGYQIVLEAGGQQYEVHTDRNGTAVAILAP